MRQTWKLRPAGAVDGAWIFFTIVSVLLLWLATGHLGLAQAQEPAAKGEPAAAKPDPPAPPAGADAEPPAKAAPDL